MISFLCSHCGAQLRAPTQWAGRSAPCPRCGKPIEAAAGGVRSGPHTPSPLLVPPESGFEEIHSKSRDDDELLAPAQGPGELGRLGPYRVLKLLGMGGMGMVFQAEDTALKRMVALKVMRKAQARQGENRARFLLEARAAAAIEHDHIVTIYQVGEDRGVPYIAMKLLQGESLEARLNREGRLPIPEVLRISQEIAEGLAEAHERGLIHRDIKPANIWLEEGRGRVKIVDFGLARACDEDIRLTQENFMVGTPMYMSPEQAEGDVEPDHRADLFSLGSVMYRMCTGELPFKGRTTMQVLTALANKKPRPLRQIERSVPQALEKLTLDLLRKNRDDRPKSARVVVALLEEIRNNPQPTQEPTEEWEEVVEAEAEEEPEPEPAEPKSSKPKEKTKTKKTARRGRQRDKEEEDAEVRLQRTVMKLAVFCGVVVVLLLGFLIVRSVFFSTP